MTFKEKLALLSFFKGEIYSTELARKLGLKSRMSAEARAGRAVRELMQKGIIRTNSDV